MSSNGDSPTTVPDDEQIRTAAREARSGMGGRMGGAGVPGERSDDFRATTTRLFGRPFTVWTFPQLGQSMGCGRSEARLPPRGTSRRSTRVGSRRSTNSFTSTVHGPWCRVQGARWRDELPSRVQYLKSAWNSGARYEPWTMNLAP